MIGRGIWFVTGAASGVYAAFRARRAAEAFTAEGLRDRVNGLGVGWRLFAEEVRAGQAEREPELRSRLGLDHRQGPPELTAGRDHAPHHPSSTHQHGTSHQSRDGEKGSN